MNRFIAVIVVAFVSLSSTATAGQSFNDRLTTLITQLALMTELASECGEQLNYYGKDGVDSDACVDFDNRFYNTWSGRDSLRDEIAELYRQVESGEQACDETCAVQIQRIEELRVTITYYLDYIDFWKEF